MGSLLAHQFLRSVPAQKITYGATISIIVLLIASFWADQAQHLYILFGLALVAKDVIYPRLRMGLLRNTEELFTPAQAEKAIPFVESALTVGTIAASGFLLMMIKFSPEASTQTLFSWWMLPIILIMGLLIFEPRILHELPELTGHKKLYESKESTIHNLRHTFRKLPFLRTLGVLILLQSAIFGIIEYQTVSTLEHEINHHVTVSEISFSPQHLTASLIGEAKEISQNVIRVSQKEIKEFSSKIIAHNTLIHDLSALHLIIGLLTLIVNWFITPYLLRKKGIIRTMLYYFIGLILVIPAMLMGGSWPVAAVRSYEHGFHSLFSAGYHITYYAAFERQREFIRHLLEGIIAPAGILLGLGTIFALQKFQLETLTTAALFVFAAGLIYLTWNLIPRYTNLAIRNLKIANNIREQLHAIEILGQAGHHGRKTQIALCQLLEKPETHNALREKIIRTLQQVKSADTIHEFSKILEKDYEPEGLKIKVLEAMLEFDSLRKFWESKVFAQHKLLRVLNDLFEKTNHDHMKKLIVMNIFSHLPGEQVVPFFLKTMESGDERLQAVCLRSCQMFNDPDIVSYIEPYLRHENSRVRSHALISMWNFHDQEELRTHLHNFLKAEKIEEIIAAIYAIGEVRDIQSLHLLEDFITHQNQELQLHALIAHAKIGNRKYLNKIIDILFGPDDTQAQKMYAMLKRVPEHIRQEINTQIKQRVAQKVWKIIGHHPTPNTLKTLSANHLAYLRRLYKFAGLHDDILILEQAL